MCRGWQEGDHETREYPGMTRGPLYMDKCIAPILDALNAAGIGTVASCCGHGVRPGGIMLADGREFIIAPDFETARIAERAFDTKVRKRLPLETHQWECRHCGGNCTRELHGGWSIEHTANCPMLIGVPDCEPYAGCKQSQPMPGTTERDPF